jgi:hypothetical protein
MLIVDRPRAAGVLGLDTIPAVIQDWPSNPEAPSAPEYQAAAGGGWLAQFAWSPNRPAPAPPPKPAAKKVTVTAAKPLTVACGSLIWAKQAEQSMAGFKHRIDSDMVATTAATFLSSGRPSSKRRPPMADAFDTAWSRARETLASAQHDLDQDGDALAKERLG